MYFTVSLSSLKNIFIFGNLIRRSSLSFQFALISEVVINTFVISVISHLNFFSYKWPMASVGPVLNYSLVKSFNLVCPWFPPLLWGYISNFIIEVVGENESSFKEIQFIAKLWKHIPVLTLRKCLLRYCRQRFLPSNQNCIRFSLP